MHLERRDGCISDRLASAHHTNLACLSVLDQIQEQRTGLLTLARAFWQLVHAFSVIDPAVFRRFDDPRLPSRVLVLKDDSFELAEPMELPAVEKRLGGLDEWGLSEAMPRQHLTQLLT